MALQAELENVVAKYTADLQEKCAFYNELTDAQLHQLNNVLIASNYAAGQFSQRPEILKKLLASECLNKACSEAQFRESIQVKLNGCTNDDDLMRRLRLFRHEEMTRIIWRDINKLAQMSEITRELSDLAEALVDESLTLLYSWACRDFGTPCNHKGEAQKLVVIGMGKLGAHELNLSSDIDLIFCFPENGETQGAARSWDNHEFFIRLGQRLIKALDAKTSEGFVFRVDMRLRPYGQSGSLALNFNSMDDYYEEQGREWERYAMIKARIVGGDYQAGNSLLEQLKPFVFRRYIDFSVISALRELKAQINSEVKKKGSENNIKIGPGGIREIEFMAQACQLIRGGREPELQERNLLRILETLKRKKLFPAEVVNELSHAYVFLRDLEHRIQALQDKQTQLLPTLAIERERVAYSMGFSSWADFFPVLENWRQKVQYHFEQFISSNEDKKPIDIWQQLWLAPLDKPDVELARLGFENAEDTHRRLCALRDSRVVGNLQQISRDRLNKLMPALLHSVSEVESPSETFSRILPLIEAILRRSAYMVLLLENPKALEHLAQLCAQSPWIAETLSRFPILLDQLLNEATLFLPPQLNELKQDLKQQLSVIPSDDLERQMEVLRHFKRAHQLRVAASELQETLPLMKVSDYLTWLAEAILSDVLGLAWNELAKKHGVPDKKHSHFIIVAYGKMGGIELSYGSDLDVVFIHDTDANAMTNGVAPIENSVFFTRLAQKIINILTTKTTSGELYEIDLRLRPSGNSGLLVSSLTAFEEYQRKDAWTWEHQALVRARPVAGDIELMDKFNAVRKSILCQIRNEQKLKDDVSSMRKKMLDQLSSSVKSKAKEQFEIKHDAGGVVDIEFMVQYIALRGAHDFPELVRYTDNVRILERTPDSHLLDSSQADLLREMYLAYRSATHKLTLRSKKTVVTREQFQQQRESVKAVWEKLIGPYPG